MRHRRRHEQHTVAGGTAEQPDRELDTLVLNLGAGQGALAVFTAAERVGSSVEISLVGALPPVRRPTVVHPRTVGTSTIYAAVFAGVPIGEYTVWRDAGTPAGTVTVRGGEVVEFRLS
ncbi:MAG TPA: hypothetical protein VHW44_11735 [Pseudonocardiaceae bacterium]|jgi:hypothetical protein|nr:hypothetical protein [Pseudonocardiaceae bacterium]